jgi:hypothetical protein
MSNDLVKKEGDLTFIDGQHHYADMVFSVDLVEYAATSDPDETRSVYMPVYTIETVIVGGGLRASRELAVLIFGADEIERTEKHFTEMAQGELSQ